MYLWSWFVLKLKRSTIYDRSGLFVQWRGRQRTVMNDEKIMWKKNEMSNVGDYKKKKGIVQRTWQAAWYFHQPVNKSRERKIRMDVRKRWRCHWHCTFPSAVWMDWKVHLREWHRQCNQRHLTQEYSCGRKVIALVKDISWQPWVSNHFYNSFTVMEWWSTYFVTKHIHEFGSFMNVLWSSENVTKSAGAKVYIQQLEL